MVPSGPSPTPCSPVLRASVRLFTPKRPTRDDLIRRHLHVVEQVLGLVRSHLHPSATITQDELRSAGYLGLIQAAEAFDPSRAVPFAGFAYRRIHGAMLDELRASDPYSRTMRDLNKAGLATAAQLRQQLGREPTREEIAAALGQDRRGRLVTPERFDRVAKLAVAGDDDTRRLNNLVSPCDIERDAIRREQVEHVWAAILTLPRRLQRVIVLYYFDDKSMAEVGQDIGVNEARISQLHARAIRELRIVMRLQPPGRRTRRGRKARACPCAKCQRARETAR